MPKTTLGSQVYSGVATLTVASGAVSSTAVSFPVPFSEPPEVFFVRHLGDNAAVFIVSAVTVNGFSVSLSGSILANGATRFEYIAHERT